MNEVLALVAFLALMALLLSRMVRQIGQTSIQSSEDEDELLTFADLTVHSPGSKR